MTWNNWGRWAAAFVALTGMPWHAAAQTSPPTVNVGIGWSALHLDKTEFTSVTDFFVTEVTGKTEDHDGQFDGARISGEIAGFLPRSHGSWQSQAALKGFYSRYENEQSSACAFSGTDSDCVFFPLFDPNPEGRDPTGSDKKDPSNYAPDLSGGFFSDWRTQTEREATHWGVAVEWRFRRGRDLSSLKDGTGVSLKDAAPIQQPSSFEWRTGLAFRKLDQKLKLTSTDFGPTADPVTLHDDLDSSYYGAYAGFAAARDLGLGYRLVLSGETGLYYSDTRYDGKYTATDTLGGGPISQSVGLSDNSPAFIGMLGIALERHLPFGTLGVFGEAEWISHMPKVLYNDVDRNGGFPFDTIGAQDGTELGSGSAFGYTLGARVSIPLR